MRRDFPWHSVLFVVVIAAAIFSLVLHINWWSDCNALGGEYVRGMSGLYKCVQGVEVK